MDRCYACGKDVEPGCGLTIPMDEGWKRVVGYYCSNTCRSYHNRNVVVGLKMTDGWEEREQWMSAEKNTKDQTPLKIKK